MSAQELWKTLTMRYRRQQICSALFGCGRMVSREPMTTSEHRLIPSDRLSETFDFAQKSLQPS
jgi:hypothetical protein